MHDFMQPFVDLLAISPLDALDASRYNLITSNPRCFEIDVIDMTRRAVPFAR